MRVARLNAGRTNQKLYFAKIAMQQLEASPEDAVQQASYEAAVFHLHGVYLAFLQELCRFYKLSPQLASAEAVRLALEFKGQISPEVVQIQALEVSGQWLQQLQQAFHDCQLVPEPAEPQPEAEFPESLIMRVAPITSDELSALQKLQAWYKQLHNLINEFRREMAEW